MNIFICCEVCGAPIGLMGREWFHTDTSESDHPVTPHYELSLREHARVDAVVAAGDCCCMQTGQLITREAWAAHVRCPIHGDVQ